MIKKYIFGIVLIVLFFKYGVGYIFSEKFQVWADQNKAQWSCHVNSLIGELYIALSQYDKAQKMFQRLKKRCPKGSLAEKATYQIAYCDQKMGRLSEAIRKFEKFLIEYPKSDRNQKITNNLIRLDSAR